MGDISQNLWMFLCYFTQFGEAKGSVGSRVYPEGNITASTNEARIITVAISIIIF